MGRKRIYKRTEILAGAIMAMIFVLALGMGIRQLWVEGIFSDSKMSIQGQAERPNPSNTKKIGFTQTPSDWSKEDEKFLTRLQEEMEEATTDEQSQESASRDESTPQDIQSSAEDMTPVANWQESQTTQGFGDWRNMWADLNLTEEEQARLQDGMRLAMERWQNMSDEERQVQMERMRQGWERWQNMSDVEREDASRQMRDRFEEWRRSGRTELPDMTMN